MLFDYKINLPIKKVSRKIKTEKYGIQKKLKRKKNRI